MARRSVVLPLPDGPSSATTSPRRSWNETPLRMSFSPRRLWTSVTTRLLIEAHSEAQRDTQAGCDEDDVDHGESGDGVHRARSPQRDDERADHLRARAEQVNAGGVFANEDHEDEQPTAEQAEAD